MEAPGRPALTWAHPEADSHDAAAGARERATENNRATEGELLAQLRAAEQRGTDELAVAAALYNLAILRRQQNDLTGAEQLYRRSLEIRRRVAGADHPDVAATLNNLAGVHAAQGDYDAARPLLERVLTIRETALGLDHPLTAQSLNNLALLYAAQGNAAAAEPLYRRAVATLEKTSGPAAQDALGRVLDNYAALLRDVGRAPEAEALEARARVIGAAHQER